jgi:hypothetical protein
MDLRATSFSPRRPGPPASRTGSERRIFVRTHPAHPGHPVYRPFECHMSLVIMHPKRNTDVTGTTDELPIYIDFSVPISGDVNSEMSGKTMMAADIGFCFYPPHPLHRWLEQLFVTDEGDEDE